MITYDMVSLLSLPAQSTFHTNACHIHHQYILQLCLNCVSTLPFIHSFISGMHHYECVAPNVDISLQSGRFSATSIALFRERFNDSRCCWVVFIHVVRGRPSDILQFSKGEAVTRTRPCLSVYLHRRGNDFSVGGAKIERLFG